MIITTIKSIRKRSGDIVPFDTEKIIHVITKAASQKQPNDLNKREDVEVVASAVVKKVEEKFMYDIPTVEEVQDIVEEILMGSGYPQIAKTYILYREKRKKTREMRSLLLDGLHTDLKLPVTSLIVLKERYLLKDTEGGLRETPEEMFRRVARAVAEAELQYGNDPVVAEDIFYDILSDLEFLPNSPTLMNAGTTNQLASCFVLPIDDSIESIFSAIKNAAIIHKSGGGTGFSFSKLRPTGNKVNHTKNVASGPVNFMKIFDHALQHVKQGGKRQGANMGVLKVDHPNIINFISVKEDEDAMQNFNISVGITDSFMDAVIDDKEFELVDPRTKRVTGRVSAQNVFDLIVLMAWKTGDPGILFLDRINNSKANPFPEQGKIETTSACGEQPLFPYEAVCLGSINLAKFISNKKIDWERLKEVIHVAVRFLDNIIDINKYPLPEIERLCKSNRRIGLGVMGWADMLFGLGIQYDSESAVQLAKEVMHFISSEADKASMALARSRGAFPNFKLSMYKDGIPLRNASRTTISPTGSISMIAGCSSSIEPAFALSFIKNVLGGKELLVVNEPFERCAKKEGFYSDELMKRIANQGTIQELEDVPEHIRDIFRINFDVSPYWHIRMQAAFQEFTDNAVSKTVNFPNWITTKEVGEIFLLAYKLGCKGITAYRDGSKTGQVMTVSLKPSGEKEEKKYCPECDVVVENKACVSCGFVIV